MSSTAEPPRVALVCSSGGHLLQLLSLEPAWAGYEERWVALAGADVDFLLADRSVVRAHGPTNRSIGKFLRNLGVAWRVLRAERFDAVISTGAALAVPFFIVGRLLGCRCIYVESLTRTHSLSLSGWLVWPLAHAFFVQWPEAAGRRREYAGRVL
jgi:UDP-N-acetylglucosamine:LPS N-acetylglucosamine transferase